MQEGHKQGLLAGKMADALAMLKEKMPVETVARITQLSLEKINELAKVNGLL